MKKFLFTLAALLMAGSAFAANVYIADREFTAEEIGTQVWLDVMVQLDNEYMNAWDFTFTYPEGLNVTSSIKKNNAVLKQTAITNEFGDEEDVSFTVNGDAYHTAAFCAQAGYWDPDGDGEYEMYGAVKIGPTGEFMVYQIRVQPTEEFTGGNIEITWMVSGGFDNRNDQTKMQVEGTTTVALTVAGGTEPEKTETPVITYDEDTFTVTATGAGEVKLYVNGEEVENPYTFELGEEETTYTVTATAQEEGKEISETAELEVTVPAAPVVVLQTEKPIIEVFDDPEAQTVTVRATGYGHICIYWDDVLQAEGEEVAEWVIPYGDDPEGEEYGVSATAQEEDKLVSDYALETVFVPGKSGEEPPYETPAPEVNAELTEDALVITATGEGNVTVYVQYIDMETGDLTTETYEGEGTVTVTIPRGEEDAYINYWAVAQADEDAVPGTTGVEYFVEVPAKEGGVEPPVDPYAEGVWLITYDMNGEEVPQELILDNGDYTGILRCSYGVYGTFDYYGGEDRPNVDFIIIVDGVRYGAAEDGTLCVLGDAMENPLSEGENHYVLEHGLGKVYNMGVAIDEFTGNMYVYAAVAGFTELSEMNADKAVAGVRYFNMAGQEMQEANGVTIVVTTYTDGTTSAVKVIK
jgi:hypothetical protein